MTADLLIEVRGLPGLRAAGLVIRGDRCISADLTLRWAKGKSRDWVRDELKRRGLTAKIVQEQR